MALVTCFGWLCIAAASAYRVAKTKDTPTKSFGAEVAAGMPSMRPALLFVPGMLAGVAWSVGNFASMIATLKLGEAVGYSACQVATLRV